MNAANTINQKLVSIVVPVYNGAPYISQCVKLIQAQTYRQLEVLLVNDGSTDDSAIVCEHAIKNDERFRLINRENGGTARARNTGLDAAKGSYIIFLDVDDEYHPEMISVMVQAMERYQVDMVACGFNFKVEAPKNGGQDYLEYKHWPDSVYHDLEEIRRDYIPIWDSDMFSTIWNKMFRMTTLRRYGMRFRDGHVYTEDRVFNRLFLSKSQSVAFVDKCLYDYVRDRPGSTTVRYRDNMFDIRHMEYVEFKQHFKDLGVWDDESREYTSREFIERIAGCIENVFHARDNLTARQKYQKIHFLISHPDVREAICYARCRSLKMRVFVLPIRWNWTLGAYVMGELIYLIRKCDPILFHKLKESR